MTLIRSLHWLIGDFLLSPAACFFLGHHLDDSRWCAVCHRRIP